MKKILLIFMLCIANVAIAEKLHFNNEKLCIVSTSDENLMLGESGVDFYNKTNNNMRVTYEVSGVLFNPYSDNEIEFHDRVTIYIKPKGHKVDLGVDQFLHKQLYNFYMEECRKYGTDYRQFRINFYDVKLINYGVENQNYETTY